MNGYKYETYMHTKCAEWLSRTKCSYSHWSQNLNPPITIQKQTIIQKMQTQALERNK